MPTINGFTAPLSSTSISRIKVATRPDAGTDQSTTNQQLWLPSNNDETTVTQSNNRKPSMPGRNDDNTSVNGPAIKAATWRAEWATTAANGKHERSWLHKTRQRQRYALPRCCSAWRQSSWQVCPTNELNASVSGRRAGAQTDRQEHENGHVNMPAFGG